MKPYQNNATPEEKVAMLKNDLHNASTFLGHTHDETGGRFQQINKTNVIGSAPAPSYPRQPDSSWSNQSSVVPSEEPIGIDVNAVEPCGTQQEIEASFRVGEAALPASAPADVCAASPGETSAETAQPREVSPSNSTSTLKRRKIR